MTVFRRRFELRTRIHNEVVDITSEVQRVVAESAVREWLCCEFDGPRRQRGSW
jgi:thiamine phosphate synthase YjbQ (UPF0047 family)